MLVLRFKDPSKREWKVPFNLPLGNTELPLGLAAVALVLFMVAGINLVTKQVATVSGSLFTLVFFALFMWSETMSHRRRGKAEHVEVEQFRLHAADEVSNEALEVRPSNTLVVARDYNTLEHVRATIERVDTEQTDIVVMTVHVLKGPDTGYRDLDENRLFTAYEQLLFSRVLSLAEKAGKRVHLAVVPASNVFDAIASTAARLISADIVMGRSSTMVPDEQSRRTGMAWERLPKKPRHQVRLHIIHPGGAENVFAMGAHPPDLTAYEVEMCHRLWLELTREAGLEGLHHRDVVTYALMRLGKDLKTASRADLLEYIKQNHDHVAKQQRMP